MLAAVLDTSVRWPSLQRDLTTNTSSGAAVVGGADAIVTSNVDDFPPDRIPKAIHVLEPAAFAADTVCVSPDLALRAVAEIARRRRSPQRSVADVLDTLTDIYGMEEAVETIRSVTD